MREVVFKELTSLQARKKNIFLREIFEKDGVVAKTERRSFYFIKNVGQLEDGEALKNWMDIKDKEKMLNRRHFHILREHSDSLGEDKVVCKIAGIFYAIVENRVYTIAFMNSFKVIFVKTTMAK